jgi:tRNA (cmo5U34)-methyltransferase
MISYNGLNDGGILILSEKIAFENKEEQNLQTDLHYEFKRANGYSELEISQKRTALENVLIPETVKQNKERLLSAGFSESFLWFQCYNFASILAIK